jgi:hypothetical protein
MLSRALAVALVALAARSCPAAVYSVTSTADSGVGTLRQAITDVNASPGPDTIQVHSAIAGMVVLPVTPLPALTDSETTIEGDVDDDGAPDLGISGELLAGGDGLSVAASNCTISGLAITNFPGYGIRMVSADFAVVRSCNLGIDLAGTAQGLCGSAELSLKGCDGCVIGGTTATRNVFAGGDRYQCGIELTDCNDNTIAGNHFGVVRDGTGVPGFGEMGILLTRFASTCSGNTIGGASANRRNVFGRLGWGIAAKGATSNHILGNYFGLLPNGRTETDLSMASVLLDQDAADNTVGGERSGARNVMVGAGVDVLAGAGSNAIAGNYLGLNAAGTRQREMIIGVHVMASTPQTIGGNTEAAGNWFAAQGPSYCVTYGVALSGGDCSLVRYNHFGIRPDGADTTGLSVGISVRGVGAQVLDNVIANASQGIEAVEAGSTPVVARNNIRRCTWAVSVDEDARPCLGNVSDASSENDGGNFFRQSNLVFIDNLTPNLIRAENNDFGTTDRSEIDAKIHDRKDDPACGLVDYRPIAGGVLATGGRLTVNDARALAARGGGAEVVFTLSAAGEASVAIVNLAGRPVATVCRDRSADAGVQRVYWSGVSDQGTALPAGVYLVRIIARGEEGQQVSAVARLVLTR